MRTLRHSLIVGIAAVALAIAGPAAASKATFTWNGKPWGAAPITIDQATYPSKASVPPIMIKLSTKKPNRKVQLQWFDDETKKWYYESQVRSRNGVARLSFNPICEGAYCEGSWSFRIVVVGTAKQIPITSKRANVTFAPLPAR